MTEEQIRRIVRQEFELAMKDAIPRIAGVVRHDVESSLPLLLQNAKKRCL